MTPGAYTSGSLAAGDYTIPAGSYYWFGHMTGGGTSYFEIHAGGSWRRMGVIEGGTCGIIHSDGMNYRFRKAPGFTLTNPILEWALVEIRNS